MPTISSKTRFSALVKWMGIALFLFFILYPFWIAFLTSFKDLAQVFATRPFEPTLQPTFEAYAYVFSVFRRPMLLSLGIALTVTLVSILAGTVGGYCLSQARMRGLSIVVALVVFGLYIPPATKLLPSMRIVQFLGLYNTNLGVGLVVGAQFLPMATILYRQFYLQYPDSFFELAKLEGANHFDVYGRIIVPLSAAPTATVFIMALSIGWNVFLYPLVLTRGSLTRRPVGVALNMLAEAAVQDGTYHFLMAGALISALPPVILYFVGQRYVVTGFRTMGLGEK